MKLSRLTVKSPGSLPSQGILSESRKRKPTAARISPKAIRSFPMETMAFGFLRYSPNSASCTAVLGAANPRCR